MNNIDQTLNARLKKISEIWICMWYISIQNKGNNKITELRTILQGESQNS
jgi:small nuclear ribonucleoprotein (snRNP)-like protein